MQKIVIAIGAVLAVSAVYFSGSSSSGGSGSGTEAAPTANGRFGSHRLAGKLVITGSSTVAPLAAEIGKRFESLHPDVRVDVQTGGSSRGIADITQGLADIGMASRELNTDEQALFAFPIAKDGICIIVHKENAVEEIPNPKIVDIYLGNITNWTEVGGKDAPITVVNKAEGRATLELFLGYFKLKNSNIKAHVVIGDNEQGVKTVSANPNAIGYVSIGTAEYDADLGVPIKLLPIGGVAASLENVQIRSYPLTRHLNLVTKTPPKGLAKAFIDYARSSKVHDIVKEQYFVPFAD